MQTFKHSSDTTPEASDVQIAALQKMGMEGRAELTFELSDNIRALTVEGVRTRHPD